MANGIEDKLVSNWSLEDSESIFKDPSSRFRMPGVFDPVSRMMGKKLLEGDKESVGRKGSYTLVGHDPQSPSYVKGAEEVLTKSLFKIPHDPSSKETLIQTEKGFEINPSSDSGQDFQKNLDYLFTEKLLNDFEMFHQKSRYISYPLVKPREMFSKVSNPDTGKKSYKIIEDVLGDVHVDENLQFSDYWNIGLDKSTDDKSSLRSKAIRAVAAPFTSPPTVTGKIQLSDEVLGDFLKSMSRKRKIREGPKAGQLSDKTEFEKKYGRNLPSLEEFKTILAEDYKKSFHEY